MLSPAASEGSHTSQVKVAPRARMLAQPSWAGSVRMRDHVVDPAVVGEARSTSVALLTGTPIPKPAT